MGIPSEEEGDAETPKRLIIVGLSCIQWHPLDRPSMKTVVQMLESEGGKLTVPPNPFSSSVPTTSKSSEQKRDLQRELEIISEIE